MKNFRRKLSPVMVSALFLTASGIISRIIGFFYRIFLSNTIGAVGMGLYSLIMPVFSICFAICAGAYQTSISAFSAAGGAKSKSALISGVCLSASSAVILSVLVYHFSGFISARILCEEKCGILVQVLALAIVPSALHSCINGYFYGKKLSKIPAVAQLLEQAFRVLTVMLIWVSCCKKGLDLTAGDAVLGIAAGETAAVFFLALVLKAGQKSPNRKTLCSPKCFSMISPVFKMSLPLILNRLLTSILSGIEAAWIPYKLIEYGLSSDEALNCYGVLTGMSMPFILFPGALTNSLAVILLPEVSRLKAGNDLKSIENTISKSIRLCILMGMVFSSLFFLFGEGIGALVFNEAEAGTYIKILSPLCPLIYTQTTLGSIQNGLGKTGATFLQNCAGTLIRLAFIYILMPVFGMKACLAGILISNAVQTLMTIRTVRLSLREVHAP